MASLTRVIVSISRFGPKKTRAGHCLPVPVVPSVSVLIELPRQILARCLPQLFRLDRTAVILKICAR
jgi:hypothetical protein